MQNYRRELEVWADIPGYVGWYQASTLGRVRSLDRIIAHPTNGPSRLQGKVLKPVKDSSGYCSVRLRGKSILIHKLVLVTFVGECPKGWQACHGNGIPTDNALVNLRWDTPSGNCADRDQFGSRNPMSSSWRAKRKLKSGWEAKVVDVS